MATPLATPSNGAQLSELDAAGFAAAASRDEDEYALALELTILVSLDAEVLPDAQEVTVGLRRRFQELRKTAETITCPVLVIRGAESDALSDEQAAAFAAALPDGRWDKVENTGHTIQGDNPRGLVRVLCRFLAEIGH
jgi:pimeloyl-ACP methyl ester carboxylesterase